MKKTNTLAICLCSALLLASFAFLVTFAKTDELTAQVFSSHQKNSFSVKVINSSGGLPVENAKIVFVKSGETFNTDGEGCVKNVSVPSYNTKEAFGEDNISYEKTSFAVYAQGFEPMLVCDFRIRSEGEKIPNIYLIPNEEYNSSDPLVICELPTAEFSENILKKYSY